MTEALSLSSAQLEILDALQANPESAAFNRAVFLMFTVVLNMILSTRLCAALSRRQPACVRSSLRTAMCLNSKYHWQMAGKSR